MRQLELEIDAGALDDLVPALDALAAVGDIIVAQAHVDRGQRRLVDHLDLAIHQLDAQDKSNSQLVIVLDLVSW